VAARVPDLDEVWLYGSAARGDMWPESHPLHSDIDLLFVTASPLPRELEEELLHETYSLFLECGRQISPNFRASDDFVARVRREGHRLRERLPHA
jgi:predicted nucleotidyltransferase